MMQKMSCSDVAMVANVKEKQEGDGGLEGLVPENWLGPRPLERQKTPFRNLGERCCHHLSLCSEGKPIL